METDQVRERSSQNRVLKVLGIGCLALFLIGIAAAVFVARNARGWAAGAARAAITEILDEANLPADQEAALNERFELLITGFEEKRVGVAELLNVGESLVDGPFARLALLGQIVRQNLPESGMSAEEQDAFLRMTQRYSRGIVEGGISPSHLEEVMSPWVIVGGDTDLEVRTDASPEELGALLASMTAAVESAGVPDEPYQIDYVQLFDRAVEEAGGGG